MKVNLILIGGLSECGKTHASNFIADNGFTHLKIIKFEKEIMEEFGIDFNDPLSFEKLYDRSHEIVFISFWNVIKAYCKANNIKNIVLDSTTRVDMIEYFQNNNEVNFISVYIETDFDKRVEREWLKDTTKSKNDIESQTIEKDKVKKTRNAHLVKDFSLIVTNNGEVNEFQEKLLSIIEFINTENFRQQKSIFFTENKKVAKYMENPPRERSDFFVKGVFINKYYFEMPLIESDLLFKLLKNKEININKFIEIQKKKIILTKNSIDCFYSKRIEVIETLPILKEYRNVLINLFSKNLPSWISNGDFHSGNIFMENDDLLLIDLDRAGWCSIAFDLCTFISYEIIHLKLKEDEIKNWKANIINIFNSLHELSGVSFKEIIILIMYRLWSINETHIIKDKSDLKQIIDIFYSGMNKNRFEYIIEEVINVNFYWR